MDRFVCPPWFDCKCRPRGKLVGRTTMLAHRRKANAHRRQMGRGLFKWGPKVRQGHPLPYFVGMTTIADHPSDTEATERVGDQESPELSGPNYSLLQNTMPNTADARSTIPIGPSATATEPQEFPFSAVRLSDSQRMSSTAQGFESPVIISNDAVTQTLNSVENNHLLTEPLNNFNDGSTSTDRGAQLNTIATGRANNAVGQYDPTQRNFSGGTLSASHEGLSDAGSSQNAESDEDVESWSDGDEIAISSMIAHDHDGVVYISSSEKASRAFWKIPELLPWLIENRDWVEMFYKHGLEENVMNDILKQLNAPFKTWKTVISNINLSSGLSECIESYAVCPEHMAYTHSQQYEICSECSSPAPPDSDETSAFKYIPLRPRIEAAVKDRDRCHELYSYRHELDASNNLLRDYFDASSYRRLAESLGGQQSLKWDVFVAVSSDGFNPYKRRGSHSIWSIAAINFNIAPDKRYAPQNVIPLAFVAGPKQPVNIQSFFRPLVRELQELGGDGMRVGFWDGVERTVRVHMICHTGDQVAICKTMGLMGPNSYMPCRDCKIRGVYVKHPYFPSRLRKENGEGWERYYNPRNLPLRSATETLLTIQDLQHVTGRGQRELRMRTGIREGSVFTEVPHFLPFESVPHDIMHTFYNLEKELQRIRITGNYNDNFSLSQNQVELLDRELISWGNGISEQLGPKPRALSTFGNWKASEFKQFSIYYAPVLYDGFFSKLYLDGIEMFAEIVDISTRAIVTNEDVARLRGLCLKFYEHFEKDYVRFMRERAHFCKSIFHILLHLAECMKRYGPLIGISQYWLEGHIGWVVERLNTKQKPAESLTRNAIFGEAFKIFYRRPLHVSASRYDEVITAGGHVLLGPCRVVKLKDLEDEGRGFREKVADYLHRKYSELGLTREMAKQITSYIPECKLFSRIRFICGSGVQTAGVLFSLNSFRTLRKPGNRPNHFVAIEMKDGEQYVGVWYSRLLRLAQFSLEDRGDCTVSPWNGTHKVAFMDYAQRLFRGDQNQIYATGRAANAFSASSAEDLSTISRLISVVQHLAPVYQRAHSDDGSMSSRSARHRRRAYFVDGHLRLDHLLSHSSTGYDNVNRILKGVVVQRRR